MEENYYFFSLEDGSLNVSHEKTLSPVSIGTLHSHRLYEIYILESESAVFHVEGMKYNMQKGDVIIFNSKEFHRIEYDTSKAYKRRVIHFDKELLLPFSDTDFDLLKAFENRAPGMYNLIPASVAKQENILQYTDDMKNAYYGNGLGKNLLIKAIFVQMLVKIGRIINIAVRENDILPKDRKIGEILKYINENLTSPLSLDVLAEKFYISKYYLSHLFKESTGYSVNKYITYKRVLLANELIRDGYPASYACSSVGFNDYSNFYKTYKKIMNHSPKNEFDV